MPKIVKYARGCTAFRIKFTPGDLQSLITQAAVEHARQAGYELSRVDVVYRVCLVEGKESIGVHAECLVRQGGDQEQNTEKGGKA